MVKLVTGRSTEYDQTGWNKKGEEVTLSSESEFLSWIDGRKITQLDTETNVMEGMYGWAGYLKGKNKTFTELVNEDGSRNPVKRECYVVQIGDFEGKDQWVFDVPSLTEEQLEALFVYFRDDSIEKIIHNALFDYTVIKWCFGIEINNLKDTFLMSKNVTCGLTAGVELPIGYNSLAGCVKRYIGGDMSKANQTTFDGGVMNHGQIIYAALDVAPLGIIYTELSKEVEKWGVQNSVKIDTSYSRACGDAMCENFYLNPDPWRVNIANQLNKVKTSKEDVQSMLEKFFPEESIELGLIQGEDEFKFRWNSPKMKNALIKLVYPDLPDTIKTVRDYKAYYESMLELEDLKVDPRVMGWLVSRDFESMELYFIKNHLEDLWELEVFVPRGTFLMNLNSPPQKLSMLKLISPDVESTGSEVLDRISHPLAGKLREYNKASKLASSYGENFIKATSPDGMFRIKGFQIVLNTGRSSMSMMQLLPGRKEYRNPFVPNNPKTGLRDDGYKWKVAGADYASQEAVVAATFAKETSLIDAIAAGCDFHSTCASLMFPDEWKKLGGDLEPKGKPKDETLLKLRGDSKAVSFGLFYGKTAIGLGDALDIPATTEDLIELNIEAYKDYLSKNEDSLNQYVVTYKAGRMSMSAEKDWIKKEHKEGRFLPDITTADDLIDRFYATFPSINRFLTNCAEDAVVNKYARTPDPVGRIRRFPTPETNGDKNAIKRQAQNSPIQGSSANMTKLAICYIKKHLDDNGLAHKMKFALPLHDEAQYLVREDFAEEGLKILIHFMEKAAEYILGNTLLKAEGAITEVWEK